MTDVGGLVVLLAWLEFAVLLSTGIGIVLRRSNDDPLAEVRRDSDDQAARRGRGREKGKAGGSAKGRDVPPALPAVRP